jgi:predicted lipoprotein with Yx(FWY)xxD motif
MRHHLSRSILILSAAGALGLGLLSACGGSAGSSGTPAPAPSASASGTGVPVSRTSSLSTSDTGAGVIVIDQNRMTLYVFTEDHTAPPMSGCTGACAAQWPPAIVDGASIPVSGGIDAKLLGTVTRSDGSKQLTLGGAPLYRYAGDSRPGEANGQCIDGIWFAANPQGHPAGRPGTPSSAPASASASATGGNGYGRGY